MSFANTIAEEEQTPKKTTFIQFPAAKGSLNQTNNFGEVASLANTMTVKLPAFDFA
jgi:hypothetical protein